MTNGLNVFLVDDDAFSRMYYSQVLQQAGFGDIKVLESGEELLEHLLDKPDIIFLDYQLNDYNGSELLEKINQTTPDTLTVILSSQQDVKISVELLNNGAFDYVVKSELDVDKFIKIRERVTELQSPVIKTLCTNRYAYVAQKEKLKVQEEFAAELHDSINPLLSVAKMFLDMSLKNPDKYAEYVNESKNVITSAVDEVRRLSHQIFFNRQNTENLENQLENFIQLLQKQNVISFKINAAIKGLNNLLPASGQSDFFMLFKELINNLIKYSEAKEAVIIIEVEDKILKLTVQDFGKGFDSTEVNAGIGLNSITNRIQKLNGQYELIAKPGKGCIWKVEIPIMDQLNAVDS